MTIYYSTNLRQYVAKMYKSQYVFVGRGESFIGAVSACLKSYQNYLIA